MNEEVDYLYMDKVYIVVDKALIKEDNEIDRVYNILVVKIIIVVIEEIDFKIKEIHRDNVEVEEIKLYQEDLRDLINVVKNLEDDKKEDISLILIEIV